MNYLDLTQDFIEKTRTARNLAELAAMFEKVTQELGATYFTCASSVDPLNPPVHAVILSNYPEEWAIHFSERKYYLIDPIFMTAQSRLTPFMWSDKTWRATLNLEQENILKEAAAQGLDRGFSVPIHCTEGFPASCSIVYEKGSMTPAAFNAVHLMSVYLHETALRLKLRLREKKNRILTERQRQCLELAAQGKSDWAISMILGVSQSTIHHHIQEALRRLDVSTRTQAIVQALFFGEIRYADIQVSPSAPLPAKTINRI